MARVTRIFFFFNDAATTEIYTLPLHDALPIFNRPMDGGPRWRAPLVFVGSRDPAREAVVRTDRKSTRLNSSHSQTSDAGLCFKNKRIHSGRPHIPGGL